MELIAFFFALVGIVYGLWALISPFIVIGLTSRVTTLEGELEQLKKTQRQASRRETRQAVATSTDAPEVVSKATRVTSERPQEVRSHFEAPIIDAPTVPLPPPLIAARTDVDDVISTYHLAAEQIQKSVAKHIEKPDPDVPPIPVLAVPSPVANMSDEDEAELPPQGPPMPRQSAPDSDEPSTLEEILAGKWLTWVGALAVIIGAGFGFKYAIENNWVGPRERVIIGILTGLACFAGGAYAIRRNYVFLAQGLTGSALGILYLSLYAAFGWSHIVSYEAAFVGMILTTTLGLSFAGYFNVQPTAVLGMIGGFLTPAMLWPDHDPMWTLFPYLLMLDLGVLLIAGVRRWAGLEILAFCGTLAIWFSWHREFYLAEHLPATAGFMTAFLVLFALLSVWHNVIRKRTANAGDFFLIFATPTVYFAALYGLTFEKYPHLQSDFALYVMSFYVVLAALAGVWHPAGRSVIAALSGLASTFLILSVPLELTGHWVAICWIAQAVLLVELGLYFREKTLAWTGLALLAKVQGILLIYFIGTLADPLHFQTAFVRIQLHLIGRPETPIDTAQGWMSLINGRSLSYLADVIGFSILAWELGRRRKNPALIDDLLPQRSAFQLWLNVTVPIVALAMIVLETFAWGAVWRWDAATIVSAWTIWTALFACGLILWSRVLLSRGMEGLGWLMFALLACFVGFEVIESLIVALSGPLMAPHRLEAWWLLNPRGVGILSVIAAAGLVALIYAAFPKPEVGEELPGVRYTSRDLMELFGTWAYALALGLVLLETRVWGAAHAWSAATIIGACAIWTTVFLLGVVVWRWLKRDGWLENILRGTFVLLQLWFILNLLGSLPALDVAGLTSVSMFDWWAFNIRGIGFLVSTFGCALAGFVLSRDSKLTEQAGYEVLPLPQWFGVTAYGMGLIMLVLETSLWGTAHGWRISTMISAAAMWTTLFLVGATLWRVLRRAAWVDNVVMATFGLLGLLLVSNTLGSAQSLQLSIVPSQLAPVDWWLINPRGLGFLLAVLGCLAAAMTYTRDPGSRQRGEKYLWPLPQSLGVGAFVTGLAMVLLETLLWGSPRGWLIGTMVSSSAAWISLFAVGLVAWSAWHRTADFDGLIVAIFTGLLLMLIVLGIGGVNDLAGQRPGYLRPFRAELEWWILNPRCIGFLLSIFASGISAWLYRDLKRTVKLSDSADGNIPTTLDVSSLFAISVYVMGLVMFSLEVYVQGTSRDWHTATSLAITLVWTSYATLTLMAGIYWRSGWVRVFSLALFVLTVGKVFLVDVWHLDTVIRVFAFISLGVALLLVSFLYRRFRDRIRSWMAPELVAPSV